MKIESKIIKIDKGGNKIDVKLYYANLCNFDELSTYISDNFVDIVKADQIWDLKTTKKIIYDSITSKDDLKKYGMVAEFFAHIILRNNNFIQQSLFENLEENSMKKGFDGLYKYNNTFWIMESKSALKDKKHKEKIIEAYKDLKESIESGAENPWKNATNHMSCMENGKRDESIKERVKKLSIEYARGIKHNLEEFNLIPVSTLFIENKQSFDEFSVEIEKYISNKNFKNMVIICIDNHVYDSFLKYLED